MTGRAGANAWLLPVLATVLVLAATVPAGAEAACYAGGDGTGTLEFAGAVEGRGFTGRFGEFDVRYCMPEGEPESGRIEVTVALASADSDNRDRDTTLKGEEFFDVVSFPESTWRSTEIVRDGEGYRAEGELTLKGITAAQPIRFTLEPDGERIVARGAFTLAGDAEVDRQRFDVGTGEFADPEFVRNRVDVRFKVELAAP
ncbi:MAG: YceI family protein [Wenzhouxiangellaceae bacterium]|nr:YceI family protein [Wenzhouxiangellaceae bacterium]